MRDTRILPRPWEQPELTHINKLPVRATLVPYKTGPQALAGDRAKSPWFKSLNGSWKFKLVDKPEAYRWALERAWFKKGKAQ